MYINSKKHAEWPLLTRQWPEHEFDQQRLLDALMGDYWAEVGNHVDAAHRAVSEVIVARGMCETNSTVQKGG